MKNYPIQLWNIIHNNLTNDIVKIDLLSDLLAELTCRQYFESTTKFDETIQRIYDLPLHKNFVKSL